MKIVVTGGSGFLGSTIAQKLVVEDHDVTVVDIIAPGTKGLPVAAPFVQGDVRDAELMSELLKGVDEVYHLAGVLGTTELQESTREAIEVNIAGTVNVFEQATRRDVRRVFYPGKPNVWSNVYTITKSAAEAFAKMHNASGNETKIMSLRYFNAYGPGQALIPIRKIVPAFAVQALQGMPIEVWGDGEQVVDLIYAEDIANLTVDFTRTENTSMIPDCGSGVRITVKEVATMVNSHFGSEAGLRHLPMRTGETPRTILTANTSDLDEALGGYTLTPIASALAATLDWYAKLDQEYIDRTNEFYGWRG